MDSNLNDLQIGNKTNQEILVDNNNINSELESKWKEINQRTKEKLKKINEARRLDELNDFEIMRIDLNSLIHPIDDSSDFEDFCKKKIKELDNMKQSIDYSPNSNNNLITFGIYKNDYCTTNSNDVKSFLKNDENDLYIKKNGKFTLNDLVQMNKNQKAIKKLNIRNLIDIIDNNDSNKSSIINNLNNFEDINFIGNNYTNNRFVKKFNEKLKTSRPTFLNDDNNEKIDNNNKLINYTQKNKKVYNKYKKSFDNNFNLNNNCKTKINTQNTIGIKKKIEENYNYLYSLYPNLKNCY